MYEGDKRLKEVMIASKRPFNVFCVSVHIVEKLIGVVVEVFGFGGAVRVGESFIEGVAIVITRVVSGEIGDGIGDG